MRARTKKKGVRIPFNTVGLVLASSLLAYALSANTYQTLSQATQSFLASASISVSAGVAPNPYNTLAQQLAQEKQRLDAREQQLDQRTQGDVGPSGQGARPVDMWGFYSLIASFALFVLVAINFYYDRKRTALNRVPESLSVDLRTQR